MSLDERKAKVIMIFKDLAQEKRTAYFVASKFELGFRAAADLLNTLVAGEYMTKYQHHTTRAVYYTVTEHGVISAMKFFEDKIK